MKNILVLANSALARDFLSYCAQLKLLEHSFSVVGQFSGQISSEFPAASNINYFDFDPTNAARLLDFGLSSFDQVYILLGSAYETRLAYEAVRSIASGMELFVYCPLSEKLGSSDEHFVSQAEADLRCTLLLQNELLSARLADFLPNVPLKARFIGLGRGEIMEVKVPVGSAFAYKHVKAVESGKKYKIALIYRGKDFLIPKARSLIFPNDDLLLVGDPSTLGNIYASIKHQQGQFPSPYGTRVCLIIDMLKDKKISALVDNALFIHRKIRSKQFCIKVINPVFNKEYENLKKLERIDCTFYYEKISLSEELNAFKESEGGLIICSNKVFDEQLNILYNLRLPVLSCLDENIKELREALIVNNLELSGLEKISSLSLDCAKLLNLSMSVHCFNPNQEEARDIEEHFEMLNKIYDKEVRIIHNTDNPLLVLKDAKALQCISFSKKIKSRSWRQYFSSDFEALHFKLSAFKLFIPAD